MGPFGEVVESRRFAEPIVTENRRPLEVAPFGEVVESRRFGDASEIEKALEAFVYAGSSAKNKSLEFGLAEAEKNRRPSRADEILAKNKSPEFAAGEAQKNGRPSRADEILAKNKSLEFAAGEALKNGRPSRAGEILAKNKSREFGLAELEKKGPAVPLNPAGPSPRGLGLVEILPRSG